MTERLYYDDCYLREFRARVLDTSEEGRRVYLDRTAFYPTSGGQPFDAGTLGGIAVKEVVDEEGRIAHLLEAPLRAEEVEDASIGRGVSITCSSIPGNICSRRCWWSCSIFPR